MVLGKPVVDRRRQEELLGRVLGAKGPLSPGRNRHAPGRAGLFSDEELVGSSGRRHGTILAHHEAFREHHDPKNALVEDHFHDSVPADHAGEVVTHAPRPPDLSRSTTA
jgi:hypothetical protein